MSALVRTGQSTARRLAFASCGSSFSVYESKTSPGKYKLAANACHDRFCLVCGQERSRIAAKHVSDRLAGAVCRFVTLTLRSENETLAELLDHLYRSFRELRRSKVWKKTQKGGIAFLEVKYSEKTNRWHPHLHVLTHGKFLDQAKLSTTWKAITKTSHIVDVRLVREPNHAVAYTAKYASKPFDPSMMRIDERLQEAIIALSGRRMIIAFGDWKGITVTIKPTGDEWEKVGTVAHLAREALAGDVRACAILAAALGENAALWLDHERAQFHPPDTPETRMPWQDFFVSSSPEIPF